MNPTHPGEAATPRSDFQTFTLMGAHLVNALHGTGEFCRTADYRALEAQHKAALTCIAKKDEAIGVFFQYAKSCGHDRFTTAAEYALFLTVPGVADKLAEAEKDAERLAGALDRIAAYDAPDAHAMIEQAKAAPDAYRSTHSKNQP